MPGSIAASKPSDASGPTPFPTVKPASRYIFRGFLYGAAVGVVAGHPLFMVAHHLHLHFGSQIPLQVTQAILHSFSYQAWPLILFFAVTGGIVGALWGRLHHRLEAHRLSYQARLRALAAEISLSEERERRRLANELHEQVGQTLAAVQIKLGGLTPELKSAPELAALKEARNLLEDSIRYIRSLTGELSPRCSMIWALLRRWCGWPGRSGTSRGSRWSCGSIP
jgi:signal transduction histidine kinase